MAHPRMYADDDPYLADVRRICLQFPESAEVEAWGRPTFRAGKKIFCVWSGTDEHPWSIIVAADEDDRRALLEEGRGFLAPYWRTAPWMSFDLGAAPDWEEVSELVESSYRRVALKRMVRALDEHPVR